jgi:ubiquinone/menaquinone biosynthesis C-methylase UbiE
MTETNEQKRWDEFWHGGELLHNLFKLTPTYRRIKKIFNGLDLPAGARILDVGCGSGKLARFWRQQGGDVVGLDISDEALAFTHGKGVAAVKGDVRKLPFTDGEFDLVYSDGLLEHFPDPDAVLAELFRVSRGVVFNLVPRTTVFNRLLVWLFRIPRQYDMEADAWVALHRKYQPGSIEHGKAFTMYAIVCKK